MESQTFEKFRNLILAESGIKLEAHKMSLLVSRIQGRLSELRLKSADDYLHIIETDASGAELITLIDTISTNTTAFYREARHFEILTKLISDHVGEGNQSLRIWCAAASSGEEPYTLAITAKDALTNSNVDCKILATDICTKVLRKALHGQYNREQISKVPYGLRHKYFNTTGQGEAQTWTAGAALKDLIAFRKLNLAKFPYPLKGPIDFIFCRNVMIYFDKELKQQIINFMTPLLKPGGYLFISYSENLMGVDHQLESVMPSVYRRPK